MRKARTVAVSCLILLLVCVYADAGLGKEVHKTFDGIKAVELSSVSGDCIVRTHSSKEVIVDLIYDVDPESAFTYEFRESGSTLIIKERWKGTSSGEVSWTLTVPADTEIEFSTASGDITASGLSADFEANTASGDVDVRDMGGDIDISVASGDIVLVNAKGEVDISTASGDISVENCGGNVELSTASGEISAKKCGGDIELSTASGDIEAVGLSDEIELSTASGDIEISDSKGTFDLGCASGGIKAKGITIMGASEFSTASGEVLITLAETSEYDLELSSASGDVVLDYNGKPVKGFFEFTANKRRGRIACPFKFDKEEEFEEHGETYLRKSFSMKGDAPMIHLSTASGKAELKK
jgi:DUF4097 and DUF4098 domain-containing protein YvlB